MKKRILSMVTAAAITAAMVGAIPASAAENPYLEGYEGEYFIQLEPTGRTWVGYHLDIHEITDEYISFDYEYEKVGHAVGYSEEKAYFTGAYTAEANGSMGYGDVDRSEWGAVKYYFEFSDGNINLKIDNLKGYEPIEHNFVCSGKVKRSVSVTLNGTKLEFDQNPVIVDGRTLVPLRKIFEALGASVDWNDSTRTVTSSLGGTTISLTIGSDTMKKNSSNVKLDVPAQIIGDRTMVPVRAVAEAFGVNVGWDDSTKTVIIGGEPTVPVESSSNSYVIEEYGIGFDLPEGVNIEKGSYSYICRFGSDCYIDISAINVGEKRINAKGEKKINSPKAFAEFDKEQHVTLGGTDGEGIIDSYEIVPVTLAKGIEAYDAAVLSHDIYFMTDNEGEIKRRATTNTIYFESGNKIIKMKAYKAGYEDQIFTDEDLALLQNIFDNISLV